MALILNITRQVVERYRDQGPVDCTYDVLTDAHGRKYLQLVTYGSSGRENPGKVSQTVRFGPEAIEQLRQILKLHNL